MKTVRELINHLKVSFKRKIMDYKGVYEFGEGMPMKLKINKKGHGKKIWKAQDIQSEEIRQKRRVKYEIFTIEHEGYSVESIDD